MTKQDCYENGCDLEKQNLKPTGYKAHGMYGFSQFFECKICGHNWVKYTYEDNVTWYHANTLMGVP